MKTTETMSEIRKNVLINAPIEKVWEAVATSEGIASWWMPSTFEPIVGKEFILHAGQYGDSPCKVTELNDLDRVSFEWGKDWQLTFELKQQDEKTEFTLIHSGWDGEKITEFGQPHAVVYSFMAGGWEKIVNEKLPSIFKD